METDSAIMNMNQLEFAVFCIENIAIRLGVNASRVYQALEDSHRYIVPEYDVLHTQSKEYIVDDILLVMQERGVEI
ncbi:DUF3791 domain-containing protein [Acutalibacter muris]|uniref:DUF3791 domain-containing protein n=1 Tax=Acutalibacter muris TaxID=1796620 RepID=UPI00272E16FE|nr:DUF3791 domain-containing protein [Acutalibacter muris]